MLNRIALELHSENQRVLNIKHADDPRPGDYWSEHFSGVAVVIAVAGGMVIFCKEKKEVDDHHWTWDLSKPTALTRAEFGKYLRYNSKEMSNKTWCDVKPQAMMWAAEEAGRV